jgi:uncharacterized protein YehS (DUF1456 family)
MGLFNLFKKTNSKNDVKSESLMDKDSLVRLLFGSVMDFKHIKDVSIILEPNEYCFFKDKCFVYEEKEVIEGYKSEYDGVSFKVMKGLNYRIGSGKSKPIKKMKETTYEGILYLTSSRIIFVCEKYGLIKE